MAAGLIVIDTPVFIIDLRYQRDPHFITNRAFLDHIAQVGRGVTTTFTLLEPIRITTKVLHFQCQIRLFG